MVIELRVVQFWSEIRHTCDFKSNSRCALVQFSNHAYDFRPNCTQLSSITIIYSGLNIQRSDLWIRCSPQQMFTNKLACLVKDLFFQERGSCETRKGLEKEKMYWERGGEKLFQFFFVLFVRFCSLLLFLLLLLLLFLLFSFRKLSFAFSSSLGRWEGKRLLCRLPTEQS